MELERLTVAIEGDTSGLKQAVKEGDSFGGQSVIINLNYDASSDASDMARDIAKNVRRYRMAGAF